MLTSTRFLRCPGLRSYVWTTSQKCLSTNSGSLAADNTKYDLIVNGGGIVGLSFIAALHQSAFMQGKRVLLLEQGKAKSTIGTRDNQERVFSNRVSSITPASKEFLERIGIWSEIQPYAKEVKLMHVWARSFKDGLTFYPGNPGLVDALLSRNNSPQDVMCHVVENFRILDALHRVLPKNLVRYESSLTDYAAKADNVDVTVNNEEKLTTSLLVGCDGFNSLVRKKSTLKYFEQPLQQKAIVATLEVESQLQGDANDVAYQRFAPNLNSVLAILPLTENYSSLVFSGPEDVVTSLMSKEESDFVDFLNEVLFIEDSFSNQDVLQSAVSKLDSFLSATMPWIKAAQLPRYSPPQVVSLDPGSRAMFPLVFGTTMPYLVGSPAQSDNKKVVLIGDAAHRVHPLAGQGLNMGIGDAECLATCLIAALSRGEKLFGNQAEDLEALRSALYQFESSRQLKVIPMMAAIQSMQTVFNLMPSTCFRAFNNFHSIKNEFVRFANSY